MSVDIRRAGTVSKPQPVAQPLTNEALIAIDCTDPKNPGAQNY